MNSCFPVIRILFLGFILWIAEPMLLHAAELTDYGAEQVSDNTWVIHGPQELPNPSNQGFMNNPAFVITPTGVVVIDPGSSVHVGRMVLSEIAEVTSQPVVAAFSTHVHGDHWLGSQAIREAYPNAVLYAHPELIALAQAGEAEVWIERMHQLTGGATQGTEAVIPETPVNDGDVVVIGDMEFRIYHYGKAHTTTDIAIYVVPENVLFTGDLVFNERLGRMDDGSFTGLSKALDVLSALNPAVVIPGHGATDDVSIVHAMKTLHDSLYLVVEQQFEAGVPDFDIKPVAVSKLADFAHWSGFDEGIGRLVSLCYLEVEENNF